MTKLSFFYYWRFRFEIWFTGLVWDLGSALRYWACKYEGGHDYLPDGIECFVCGAPRSDAAT